MPTNQCTPIPELSAKDIARFWSRVKLGVLTECWPWRSGVKHARFYAQGVKLGAHRVAYFLATGIDPGQSLICHDCDNPPCCNYTHLHPGTNLSNMQEASQRGRMKTGSDNRLSQRIDERSGERHWTHLHPEKTAKGDGHPKAKLVAEQVLEIRRRYANGETCTAIARDFPITIQAVHYIVTRRHWKHL